jgi:uncharacterized coiled-coil protein SlyX
MRRLTYRLTRSVDASVFVSEAESGQPTKTEAVVIRPRVGSGGDVSVFALRQITAEMLRAEAERDANRDDSDLDALTQGDPWAVLRAELLDLALVFPDYTPAEFDTARASRLLELLTVTIGKLRDELRTIAQRLLEIDSDAALQYLHPDAATPPATTRPSEEIDTLAKLRDELRTIAQRLAEVNSEAKLQLLKPAVLTSPATTRPSEEIDTFGKLRDELRTITQRLVKINSDGALKYLHPDAATPPATTRPSEEINLDRLRETLRERGESKEDEQRIDDFHPVLPEGKLVMGSLQRAGLETANLTFNRRTGLWVRRTDGREIVALPSRDGVEPPDDSSLELFDVISSPKADGDTPDFIIRGPHGAKTEVRVKGSSALRRTRATRPRQISAAIAALEARQNGDHIAGRYAVVAKTLGIPPEKPVVVQRLVASVVVLISNPETVALVRFLAPREVGIDKVIERVLTREKPATKTRRARKGK